MHTFRKVRHTPPTYHTDLHLMKHTRKWKVTRLTYVYIAVLTFIKI